LKRLTLGVALALCIGCGGEPLNPEDFELSGDWGGSLIQGAFGLGVLRLAFNPREDGVIERYDVEGTLFFSNVLRRIDGGRAEFDTGAGTVLLEFPIFPTPVAALNGSYDGSVIEVSDSVLCFCSMLLTQDSIEARIVPPTIQ